MKETKSSKVRFQSEVDGNSEIPNSQNEMNFYLQSLFKDRDYKNSQKLSFLLTGKELESLSENQVFLIISSLSLFISSFDSKLTKTIIAFRWLDRDHQFIKAYTHLVLNMVSNQSHLIQEVASMLIDNFVSGPEKYSSIPFQIVYSQSHTIMMKLLNLIPLGADVILPLLAKRMPHKSESLQIQSGYVSNLLHLSTYVPVIRNQIIGLVLDLIVQIDIDIPIDDIETALDGDDDDEIFEMEMEEKFLETFANENAILKQEESEDEEDEKAISESSELSDQEEDGLLLTSDSKIMICKLDSLICLFFDYIVNIYNQDVKANDFQNISDIFDGLLQAFKRTILPTHKLRSTQFILFYICSLAPDVFPEDFMGLLVSHSINHTHSSVIRMSSCSYLGSFIARAKFVELHSVRRCLSLLNQLCQDYVEKNEMSIKGSLVVEKYGVVYSAVQSILYIFCFRWKQLMVVNDRPLSGVFPPELNGFQRVIMSKFNPLRVCSEAIVQEFAKITHHLNIMYCYPLMQSSFGNENSLIVQAPSSQVKMADVMLLDRLETFFPFDPLNLPRARKFVEQSFQEWGNESEAGDNLTDPSDSDIEASLKGMSLDEKLSLSLG